MYHVSACGGMFGEVLKGNAECCIDWAQSNRIGERVEKRLAELVQVNEMIPV